MSYKPNFAGFRAAINGPEVRAMLRAEAEKAKTVAEGLSQDFRVTGEYASSFETSIVEVTDVGSGTRPAARLTNTAGYAAAVEWGFEGRAAEPTRSAHHVLKRTLDALGD